MAANDFDANKFARYSRVLIVTEFMVSGISVINRNTGCSTSYVLQKLIQCTVLVYTIKLSKIWVPILTCTFKFDLITIDHKYVKS